MIKELKQTEPCQDVTMQCIYVQIDFPEAGRTASSYVPVLIRSFIIKSRKAHVNFSCSAGGASPLKRRSELFRVKDNEMCYQRRTCIFLTSGNNKWFHADKNVHKRSHPRMHSLRLENESVT